MGFHHAATEVFQKTHGWLGPANLTVCDGSGEDPACADSIDFFDSVDDHLKYWGIKLGITGC